MGSAAARSHDGGGVVVGEPALLQAPVRRRTTLQWIPAPDRGRGAEQTARGSFLSFRCRDRWGQLVYATPRFGPMVRIGLFKNKREARRAVETWHRTDSPIVRELLVARWFREESIAAWARLEAERPRLYPRHR